MTLGPDVRIEDGVRIQDTAILSGAIVHSHSWLDGSIVGWNSNVGRWVRLILLEIGNSMVIKIAQIFYLFEAVFLNLLSGLGYVEVLFLFFFD